jgi:hypothetical protein
VRSRSIYSPFCSVAQTALLPVYARDILSTDRGAGLLRSSTAVGALAMALYLARRPLKRHAGRLMFAAVALFGIATIVFGVSALVHAVDRRARRDGREPTW